MSDHPMRGRTAISGLGETKYYKRAAAPDGEFKMCLEAILLACEDAGVDPRDIDGFASYSNERSSPDRLAAALGIKEMRLSNMFWGGGGGGGSGALANAVSAIISGQCEVVVVYRSLAQGQFGRFGQGAVVNEINNDGKWTAPFGLMSPAQSFAMRVRRFMHENGVQQEALRAISMASYFHAQQNPRAVMHGRELTEEIYDQSRWIVEPFHLFDCCMENDGAAAMIVTSVERARDLKPEPAVVLAAAQGSTPRNQAAAHNADLYATSNFQHVAKRLYEIAGVGPKDVDVAQVYENFTGGVMMSIVEHGLCAPDEVNEFFTLENFKAPDGKMPINTSGGNLAECYMHGLELIIEAAQQLRGQSPNQLENPEVALVASGPMVTPVSSCILGVDR